MNQKTSMLRQIESIPELMKAMEMDLRKSVEGFLEEVDPGKFKRIILTGCGDSLCSCMAVKYAFMKYTGLLVDVVTVMDLARVYKRKDLIGDNDTLIVVVSNSGNVARVIELAKRIRKIGGFAMAVTGSTESELYAAANTAVQLHVPPFEYAPGIRSYCGCVDALIHLAVGIGEKEGLLSRLEAEKVYTEIAEAAEKISLYIDTWEEDCKIYARQLKNSSSYEFIGSGVHYASAWFGHAKSLETTGIPSSALNTEDWFHMNFFVRDVYHTAAIVCTSEKDGGLSRMKELIDTAEKMGRPLICITDTEKIQAAKRIIIPKTETEELYCLIEYIPLSILMSYIGDLLGEVYFRDGKNNWSACVNCATLINSEEIILD